MMLDTGVTVAEVIDELRTLRASWGPKIKITSNDEAVALLNVFGAFK